MSKKDLRKIDRALAFLEVICFIVMAILYFKEMRVGFAWFSGSFVAFLLAHAMLHPIKEEDEE